MGLCAWLTGSLSALLLAVPSHAAELEENPHQFTLRVLTLNINGLPPPLKDNAPPLMERIAEILRQRRAQGTQPHVVLLQEAFSSASRIVVEKSGYEFVQAGPGADAVSAPPAPRRSLASMVGLPDMPQSAKLLGSGLYVLSDYEIEQSAFQTFGAAACAGFDCFANKAVMWVRFRPPRFRHAVNVITSHMNSDRSAGVPVSMRTRAHAAQTDILARFIETTLDPGEPLILAGDFNTSYPPRLVYFRSRVVALDSAEICLAMREGCRIGAGTRPDELLYHTNDKHYYRPGRRATVRPLFSLRNFREEVDGRPLSDHTGYEVHYALAARPSGRPRQLSQASAVGQAMP